MKVIALLLILIVLIVQTKKQIASQQQYKLNLPIYETRAKMFGTLNHDPKILAKMYGQGITPYYNQMLHNPQNYLISQDIKQKSIDLEKEVQLYRSVSKKDQMEDINYGELNEHVEEQQRKQHYTADYDQMLVDPSLRYLTLGMHPELNTDETRVIQNDYEDPYIRMNDEELQQLKKQQQKKMAEYRNKIELFLQKMENKNKVDASEHEKKVLNEIKAFVDMNAELKDLKERIGNIVQKFSKKANELEVKFKKQEVKYDTSYQREMDKQYGQSQKQESVVKNSLIDKAKKEILEKVRKDIEQKKDGTESRLQQVQFEKDLGDDQLFDDLEQVNKKIQKKQRQKGDRREEQKREQNERLKQIDQQGDRLVDMIDELEESSKEKEKKKKKKKGKKMKI